jgi:hypothetical protein
MPQRYRWHGRGNSVSGFLKSPRLTLSENEVEKACLDLLRYRGWWPIRLHAGLFKSADDKRWIRGVEKGTPDYVAVRAPSFFVETKRTDGKLSDLQSQKIFQLKNFYGLETAVVKDSQDLLDWLDQHRPP